MYLYLYLRYISKVSSPTLLNACPPLYVSRELLVFATAHCGEGAAPPFITFLGTFLKIKRTTRIYIFTCVEAEQGSDPKGKKNRLKIRLRIRLRISLRFPIQWSPLVRATDVRSTRLYGQFLASPDQI